MIRKSQGRAGAGVRRAGTLTLAALAAGAVFVVVPQLGNGDHARADGPVGAAAKNSYGAKKRQAQGPVIPQHRPAKQTGATIQVSTGAPKKILPGATYSWPYAVSNKGFGPAKSVTFATPLDQNLKLVAASQKCSWEGAQLVCQLGTLGRGESKSGVITATVAPNAKPGQVIASKTLVTWHSTPSVRSKAGAFPPVKVPATADLALTKSAPGTVRPGAAIPYKITVTNNGPVTARGVVLQDSFPMNLPVATAGTAVKPGGPPTKPGEKPGGVPSKPGEKPGGVPSKPGEKPGGVPSKPGEKPGGVPSKPGEKPGGVSTKPGGGGPGKSGGGAMTPGEISVKETSGSVACTTQGTGFYCELGSLPPNTQTTLTLMVKPGPRAKPGMVFRPISKVSSATLDVKPGNNRVTSYTRVAAAGGAPMSTTPSTPSRPQLPATGNWSPQETALGAGLVGLGILLVALACRQSRAWRKGTC